MSTQTKRGLIKPDRDDNYSIGVFNDNCDKIEEILDSAIIITIPADTGSNYTTNTDSDRNTYYTIDINVTGVTPLYSGLRDMKPVYPRPYNVDAKSEIDDLFSLIQDGDSLNGAIRLFFNELPTESFQVYLYGV